MDAHDDAPRPTFGRARARRGTDRPAATATRPGRRAPQPPTPIPVQKHRTVSLKHGRDPSLGDGSRPQGQRSRTQPAPLNRRGPSDERQPAKARTPAKTRPVTGGEPARAQRDAATSDRRAPTSPRRPRDRDRLPEHRTDTTARHPSPGCRRPLHGPNRHRGTPRSRSGRCRRTRCSGALGKAPRRRPRRTASRTRRPSWRRQSRDVGRLAVRGYCQSRRCIARGDLVHGLGRAPRAFPRRTGRPGRRRCWSHSRTRRRGPPPPSTGHRPPRWPGVLGKSVPPAATSN
jgi:hypothetical protein